MDRRYTLIVERTTLLQAIKDCFSALRIHHGWGIAEVAEKLGVHYETARRLRAGEIKDPSFSLICGLHGLAHRSMDNWAGTVSPGLDVAEERIRELVLDQLQIMLGRTRTAQPAPSILDDEPNSIALRDASLLRDPHTEGPPMAAILLASGAKLTDVPAAVPTPDTLESVEPVKRRPTKLPAKNRKLPVPRR